METWFLIVVTISISVILKSIFTLLFPTKTPTHTLPPGPSTCPIIGDILLLCKPVSEIERMLKSLHAKLGPMVTLPLGFRPAIFVADRTLAHQALVQNGAVFADRLEATATDKIFTSNQHNISSSFYGPTWRLLRRNLTAEILHPSRANSYSHTRKWVLETLLNCCKSKSQSGEPIHVMKHFQYAMFSLLVVMCFGDQINENQIKEVENVQRQLILGFQRFSILNFSPRITKIILYKRWNELFNMAKRQKEVLLPLIRERKSIDQVRNFSSSKEVEYGQTVAYVDTLFNLQLPEEKRNLTENEIMSLCSEFLIGGTDTTSTALQWVMANLVKYQHVQDKLYTEIKENVGDRAEHVKEDDLKKMPYLEAVILESLRRHPPAHFVVPHTVTEDVVLNGCLLPKNCILNFMVAEMGWDSSVWDDPMAFKPERFLRSEDSKGEAFDITGSREIKMMPFGVGRRICPGLGLAMLHLQYFTANLVFHFKWNPVDGDEVDLSDKHEFTMVMKYPLKANIFPRIV